MKAWHNYTQQGIEDMAEAALNQAVRHIQDMMRIETGDAAGFFWTGEKGDIVLHILKQYIKYEIEIGRAHV